MAITSFAITDVGKMRKNNEDNFIVDDELGLFVVADGMGGQAAGDVASQMAVDTILASVRETAETADTWTMEYDRELSHGHNRLRVAMLEANAAIQNEAAADATKNGMGTTAVCTLAQNDLLEIAHIGDSRAYLYRDGELKQLTEDHTLVDEQVRQGLITSEQARNHPMRNIITRALGAGESMAIDHIDLSLQKGDVVLLCSDGLSGMIDDELIAETIAIGEGDIESVCSSLVRLANEAGGRDNITAVMLRYDD